MGDRQKLQSHIVSLEIDGELFKFKVSSNQDTSALKKASSVITKTAQTLRKKNPKENYARILLLTCLHLLDEKALTNIIKNNDAEKEVNYQNNLKQVKQKLDEILETIALAQIAN